MLHTKISHQFYTMQLCTWLTSKLATDANACPNLQYVLFELNLQNLMDVIEQATIPQVLYLMVYLE